MVASSQDVFVSCGFDCQINVYDTRKRSIVHRYTQPSPLSTICVSACGTYCVTGNLKGEISSFDFRNMSNALETKRSHDSSVVRVAFIPSNATEFSTANDDINITHMELDPAHSAQDASKFLNFVDRCKLNQMNIDEDGLCTPNGNDKENSWDDLLRSRQQTSEFSMLDSPGMTPMANMSEHRLSRASLLRLSGSPINGLPQNAIVTTPKSAKSKSGLLISTPLSFKEPSDVEHMPEKPAKSKATPVSTLHRRSSFSEEFNKCIQSTNMSTPLLRTETPKNWNHIIHDVIEEESLSSQATLPVSTLYESQLAGKENQHDNYQNPPTINPMVNAHQSIQHKQANDILTDSNTEIPNSLKVQDGIISMTTEDFAAIINSMKCDMVKSVKCSKKYQKYLAREIVGIARAQYAQECQAKIKKMIESRDTSTGRNFGTFFKLRMDLDNIEKSYEKLLSCTPAELADKLPILRQEWKLMCAQTRGVTDKKA